jgi:plastocyanin
MRGFTTESGIREAGSPAAGSPVAPPASRGPPTPAIPTRMRSSRPLLLLALVPAVAGAQGTVAGRVSVLERSGARTADLANAVVWLEPAGADARRAAPAATEIVMDSRDFRPAVRVVPAGSTVRFPNYDPFRHNVFSDTGPDRFDLGLYGRGESRGATVGAPGIYPIFCNIHARMVAYVLAVPSPWFAQAGADGSWQIASVPAGRYRLHAWHDRGGELVRDLDVAAGERAQADVQLDARGWRRAAHKNKHGRDYPPETRDRY